LQGLAGDRGDRGTANIDARAKETDRALLAASPKIGDQKISAYAKTADSNPNLALISASHDHTNRHLNFMSE
jgi:hypothetical protein